MKFSLKTQNANSIHVDVKLRNRGFKIKNDVSVVKLLFIYTI